MARSLELTTPEILRGGFRLAALLPNKLYVPVEDSRGRVGAAAAADTYESPVIAGCNGATGATAASITGLSSADGAWTYVTSPAGLEILSSAASDNSAGIGARSILIVYLDTGSNVKTELVVPNGATPVPTVATDIYRVLWIEVMTAGTNKFNTGNIVLRKIGGGINYAHIRAQRNLTSACQFTVPIGKAFLTTGWETTHQSDAFTFKACRFRLRAGWNRYAKTSNNQDGTGFLKVISTMENIGATCRERFATPTAFPAGTDIDVEVDNPNASVIFASGQIHGTLVDA
jgi:hypothetical protein